MTQMKVYTGGTFDTFHAGHAHFLAQCSRFGNVTVALNTDEFVERYKGRAPITSYEERRQVLNACRYVYNVTPNFGEENSGLTIVKQKPDIIAIGTDWLKKDYLGQLGIDEQFLYNKHIGLMFIAYTPGISSTNIKERITKVSK